jgi:transposase
LDLRPVNHRREDRIRAHILLCWLAVLLIRFAETTTGHTWNAGQGCATLRPSHIVPSI